MRRTPETKQHFAGTVLAVKARIRLIRSFDQVSHNYEGYTLVLDGTLDEAATETLRVALGPQMYEKHQFRIGDRVEGMAVAVADPRREWATHYRVSGLRLVSRGPEEQDVPAHPEGGVAPPLAEYRAAGHRRLDPRTYAASCTRCPFGLTMATEIIIDQWNPSRKKWRFETQCYGPRGCPRYRPGKARQVPGRQPGMVWVDDDVEREAAEYSWESSERGWGSGGCGGDDNLDKCQPIWYKKIVIGTGAVDRMLGQNSAWHRHLFTHSADSITTQLTNTQQSTRRWRPMSVRR